MIGSKWHKIAQNPHRGLILFMGIILSVFVGCLIYAFLTPNPAAMVAILAAMWDLM